MTALEAFQEASRLNHKIALSGCMTTKAYASSYMSDDIKNYLRKQISLDNTDVITYFNNNGLDLSF